MPRSNARLFVKDWESSLTISAKSGGVGATSQPLNSEGRTIWIVDAHGYGKRFIVRADELLTAFLQLESAIRRRYHSLKSPFSLSKVESQLQSHAVKVRNHELQCYRNIFLITLIERGYFAVWATA